jgi:hypothetical protein
MSRAAILGLAAAVVLTCAQARAQDTQSSTPPSNAKKLSEIVASVEKRDNFQFIDDLEWDDDGYYEITYYTSDKAKVEIRIDPVSGNTEPIR